MFALALKGGLAHGTIQSCFAFDITPDFSDKKINRP
jgi:hypothetical protein